MELDKKVIEWFYGPYMDKVLSYFNETKDLRLKTYKDLGRVISGELNSGTKAWTLEESDYLYQSAVVAEVLRSEVELSRDTWGAIWESLRHSAVFIDEPVSQFWQKMAVSVHGDIGSSGLSPAMLSEYGLADLVEASFNLSDTALALIEQSGYKMPINEAKALSEAVNS